MCFHLIRADGGVVTFSLEPHELSALIAETQRAWQSLGGVRYGPTEKEKNSMIFRRSIYVSKDIKAGEAFTSDNIRIVRPGHGAPPWLFDHLIGRDARCDYVAGTALNLDELF